MIVTAYNPKGFARAARKVVVDVDANELADKTAMAIDQPLAMDAGDFIQTLLAAAIPGDTTDWRARCTRWKARYTQNEGRVFPPSGPIGHAHFVEALSDAAPADTLIATGSSGLAVEFFYAGFRNKRGQRTFLTSGLGAMGYGLPAAIGACLGNDRKPMLAVESDGSLQLNLQELATLTGLQLPICLFIMNNGGYAPFATPSATTSMGATWAAARPRGYSCPISKNSPQCMVCRTCASTTAPNSPPRWPAPRRCRAPASSTYA